MNKNKLKIINNPIVISILAGVFLIGVMFAMSKMDTLLGIKPVAGAVCTTCTLSNIAPPPVNGFVSKSEVPINNTNEKGVNMKNTNTANINGKITPEKNFNLMDTNGITYSLADLSGKIVYVKFWATWCPICMGGIEELTQLSKTYVNNDQYAILTIASPGKSGEKNKEDFTKWFNGQKFEFTALLDEGGKVAAEYGVKGYPTNVFIGKDGKVFKTVIGHMSNDQIEEVFKGMK